MTRREYDDRIARKRAARERNRAADQPKLSDRPEPRLWSRRTDGLAVRHELSGTPWTVTAAGGSMVVGYSGGGNARRHGARRFYVDYNGSPRATFARLRDAKEYCEARRDTNPTNDDRA